MTIEERINDPRCIAAINLIGRSGADNFQIRYSDDQQPVVWVAVATYRDPLDAVLRLCGRLIDGVECTHCHKVIAFDSVFGNEFLDGVMCWTFTTELKTYSQSCAGEPDVDRAKAES